MYIGEIDDLKRFIEDSKVSFYSTGIFFVERGKIIPQNIESQNGVLVGNGGEESDVAGGILDSGLNHMIQQNHPDLLREIKVADAMMANSDNFFQKMPEFLLSPDGSMKNIVTEDFKFNHSKEKEKVVKVITKYVEENVPGSRNILDAVALISDEMYMNAIFDAPTDDNGEHLFAEQVRSKSAAIDEDNPAKIFVSHDGDWLVIGCEDPFGSLVVQPLLKRINETYRDGGMAHIRSESNGGAGLGCRLMFEYSTSLYIGVKKGEKTVFVCKLPLNKSRKIIANMPKNVHFLEVES